MKRILDLIVALAALVVAAPLMALVAAAIRLDSPGAVIYRARRAGLHGVPFDMLKFRTMRAGAGGPLLTMRDDPRVTRVGRWLRSTKLDELPQLVNLVCGEMSLVGPRPEDPRYVARYTDDERRLLGVKPGLVSRASLQFSNEERLLSGPDWERKYCEEILPRKLAMELQKLRIRN